MPWIIGGLWLACGLFASGMGYAFLQREFFTIAKDTRIQDGTFSLLVAIVAGPAAIFFMGMGAGHGWLLPFTKDRRGDNGHRGSEASGQGGAGAVQGATGSPGGAQPNTPAGASTQMSYQWWDQSYATLYALGPQLLPVSFPSKRGDGVPVETRDTEIVAWRAWLLVQNGEDWYLRSFFYPEQNPMRWEGPAVRADRVPEVESLHGIYALTKERFDARYADQAYISIMMSGQIGGSPLPPSKTSRSDGRYKTEGVVYGEVALSGTVVEGTHGYRAEQAAIRSLTLKMDKAWEVGQRYRPIEIAAALEDRYQCPVSVYCHVEPQ